MRNFWHIQLHPNNQAEFPREKVRKILEETHYIGMGEWEDGWVYIDQFKNVLKTGDIVLVRSKGPLALVEVIGEPEKTLNPNVDFDWFENRRLIKVLQFFDNHIQEQIGKKVDGTFNPVTFASANSSEFIKKWYSLYSKTHMLDQTISLLKYKKQIILQGPPGTGKTRLAKEIAKELTVSVDKGSPLHKINEFFKNFNPEDPKVKATREEFESKLKAFYEKFPKEELHKMSLEDYCIGTGANDSFCWWIERGLQRLGYYFPGSSRSYLIYYSKTYDQYSTHFKHSPYLSEAKNIEEAMSRLAEMIAHLVAKGDTSKVDLNLGTSFIIKILNSYYPEKYFPINGKVALNNLCKLLKIDRKGLSALQMNLKVQEFFDQKKKEHNVDIKNYDFMLWLFDEFDLKGEIDFQENNIITKGETKLIQFHPAYTYEDFVRGIVVETNDDNKPEYRVVNKVLGDFAEKALKNHSANFVLIIDEINRANLPSVLGELIYALEYRFDKEDVEGTTVESMYSLKSTELEEEFEDKKLVLPKNLFIIGTMNTADRSVGHIDYAIRRRFAFVDVLPRLEPVHDHAKVNFELVSSLFVKNPKEALTANSTPERSECLSPDFRPEDVWIGHSYFLTDKTGEEAKQEISIKMKYEVVPLLKEYLKDGILIDEAKVKEVIQSISH